MAVIQGGSSNTLADVGLAAFKGMHVTQKPIAYDAGHYRLSIATGTIAAALAANSVVFSFRNAHPTIQAILTRLRTRFMPLTPFTAATLTDAGSFDAYSATVFTGSHTGGTAITLTGTALKVRQTMGSSNMADIRIATTAALGGGSLTLTAHPFAASMAKANRVNPAAATEETIMPPFDGIDYTFNGAGGEHPNVFGNSEGFVLRNRTVWPAAGTGILLVEIGWAEASFF